LLRRNRVDGGGEAQKRILEAPRRVSGARRGSCHEVMAREEGEEAPGDSMIVRHAEGEETSRQSFVRAFPADMRGGLRYKHA